MKNLRNKMEALNNETLVEAFMKSNKTLEESIAFFESDTKAEEAMPKTTTGRRNRKRKASK